MSRATTSSRLAPGAYPNRPQISETALEKAVRAPQDYIWRISGSAKRLWNSSRLDPELWSKLDQAWKSVTGKHLPPDMDPACACLQAGFWLDTGAGDFDETLTAVTAAVSALKGRRVHVAEESLGQAQADSGKLVRFWRELGLSAVIHDGSQAAGTSPYAHDIVIVPMATLMSDFLHDVIKVGDPRNLQSFHAMTLWVGGRAGDQWRLKGLDVLILPKATYLAVDRAHSTTTLSTGGEPASILGRITVHRFLSRYRTIAGWDSGLDVVAAGLWHLYRTHVVRWGDISGAADAPTRFICRRDAGDAAQEIKTLATEAASEGRACRVVTTADRLKELQQIPGIPDSITWSGADEIITGGQDIIDLIPASERARLRMVPDQDTRVVRMLVAEDVSGTWPGALLRLFSAAGGLRRLPSGVVRLIDGAARRQAANAAMAALGRAVEQERRMNDLLAISPGRVG